MTNYLARDKLRQITFSRKKIWGNNIWGEIGAKTDTKSIVRLNTRVCCYNNPKMGQLYTPGTVKQDLEITLYDYWRPRQGS